MSVQARASDWRLWCEAAGVDATRLIRYRVFESSTLTCQGAVQGHGVALARKILVQEDLDDGRRVMPLDGELDRRDETYDLAFSRGTRKRRQVKMLLSTLVPGSLPTRLSGSK